MLSFRLLYSTNPSVALADAIRCIQKAQSTEDLYITPPSAFSSIPTAPFAYWSVAESRALFSRLSAFEGNGRTSKQGLSTADDFRFVRTAWEKGLGQPEAHQLWFPFAKGGTYSTYYGDLSLELNWRNDGRELKAWASSLYNNSHWSRIIKNVDYYLKPGMTWPLRGIVFSAQAVPRGAVFSIAGKLATSDNEKELPTLMCLFNSKPFDYLIRFFAGKVGGVQYEVGLIGNIPVFDLTKGAVKMKGKFEGAWSTKRSTDTANLTSHAFHAPALAPGRKPHTR